MFPPPSSLLRCYCFTQHLRCIHTKNTRIHVCQLCGYSPEISHMRTLILVVRNLMMFLILHTHMQSERDRTTSSWREKEENREDAEGGTERDGLR